MKFSLQIRCDVPADAIDVAPILRDPRERKDRGPMRYAKELPKRQGNYKARYPWREIAESGQVGVLVRGDDYDGHVQKPLSAAYQWAKTNGYRVKTRTDWDKGELYVEFSRLA